jgi:uncharacterized protein
MFIEREITTEIKPFLNRREAISIIGPRQSGKTTLAEHLIKELRNAGKKVKFITFEKKAELDLFQNNIEDFKEIAIQYDCVVIDEFQYSEDGGQKLKYLYDTTRVKFIVTGSSSLELKFQTGKYMVGRIFNFELLPFSFREFLAAEDREILNLLNSKLPPEIVTADLNVKKGVGKEINKRLSSLVEKFAVYGGYPAVVLSKTETEKVKVLESIVDNYLLKDIRGLLHLATEDELMQLQKFLAAQTGNLIKYDELSYVSRLAFAELKKHLAILEKTYIIELIRPFYANRRTELVKNPKVFFIDTGVRNYLLQDFRGISIRNDAGALMENQAFTGLRKKRSGQNIKYWRTKSKAEVDFIVEKGRNILPIEVKYSSQITIGKSLHSFIEKFNPGKAVILTKDLLHEEETKNCRVKFIPLGYL